MRMGTQPAVTDEELQSVLRSDFAKHGVEDVQFYFEQYDAKASVISFHIRGGTEGPFVISNVRQEIPKVANRAKNKNPIFRED